MIELTQVEKQFCIDGSEKVHVLHNISLRVKKNQCICIEGPSGSGKTTLLSILGGLYCPTSGSASVNGIKISRLPELFLTRYRREQVGFIYQHYNLLENMTVLQNVCLPLVPLGIHPIEQRKRALNLLKRFGLLHRKNYLTANISGGEQQRTAIARALINDPPILIGDEPTAHLDGKLSHDLFQHLGSLKEDGKTLILASHDPFVLNHSLVDVRYRIDNGNLLQVS